MDRDPDAPHNAGRCHLYEVTLLLRRWGCICGSATDLAESTRYPEINSSAKLAIRNTGISCKSEPRGSAFGRKFERDPCRLWANYSINLLKSSSKAGRAPDHAYGERSFALSRGRVGGSAGAAPKLGGRVAAA